MQITIQDEDWDTLRDQLDNMIRKTTSSELLKELVNDAALEILENSESNWAKYAEQKDRSMTSFVKEIDDIWHEPIKHLRKLKVVFYEEGESAFADVAKDISDGTQSRTSLLDLSFMFHARACQLLDEIITLIRCGYPEAAMARWRTLHEVNVTASFIFERGEELAERYLLHDATESFRAMKEYCNCCERLGYDPISQEEYLEAEQRAKKLISRFGQNYGGPYGWASEFLNDARPNFSAIEKATGLDHLRVHYRLASHGVHANPKGITDRLSQPDYTDALIAGPSVFGLESPITCTAVTATQLFATLGTQWSSIDSLIAVKYSAC